MTANARLTAIRLSLFADPSVANRRVRAALVHLANCSPEEVLPR